MLTSRLQRQLQGDLSSILKLDPLRERNERSLSFTACYVRFRCSTTSISIESNRKKIKCLYPDFTILSVVKPVQTIAGKRQLELDYGWPHSRMSLSCNSSNQVFIFAISNLEKCVLICVGWIPCEWIEKSASWSLILAIIGRTQNRFRLKVIIFHAKSRGASWM